MSGFFFKNLLIIVFAHQKNRASPMRAETSPEMTFTGVQLHAGTMILAHHQTLLSLQPYEIEEPSHQGI